MLTQNLTVMKRTALSIVAALLVAAVSTTLLVSCENEYTIDDATGKVIVDGKRYNLSSAHFERHDDEDLEFTMTFVTQGLIISDEGCMWDGKTQGVYIIGVGGTVQGGGEINGTYPGYQSTELSDRYSMGYVEYLTDFKYADGIYGDDLSNYLGYDSRAGKHLMVNRHVEGKSFDIDNGELKVKQNANDDSYKVSFNGQDNGHSLKITFNGEMDDMIY